MLNSVKCFHLLYLPILRFILLPATCDVSLLRKPCQNHGYQDPLACHQCRCPSGWEGQYCTEVQSSRNVKGQFLFFSNIWLWCFQFFRWYVVLISHCLNHLLVLYYLTEGCGGYLTSTIEPQTLKSPGYDKGNYSDYQECSWIITVSVVHICHLSSFAISSFVNV